jgi:hypothetical protein
MSPRSVRPVSTRCASQRTSRLEAARCLRPATHRVQPGVHERVLPRRARRSGSCTCTAPAPPINAARLELHQKRAGRDRTGRCQWAVPGCLSLISFFFLPAWRFLVPAHLARSGKSVGHFCGTSRLRIGRALQDRRTGRRSYSQPTYMDPHRHVSRVCSQEVYLDES